MDDLQNRKSAPPPGSREALDSVGDFVVSMIQAFLRTGYYLPDHPEAKRAKEGLHEKFIALTRQSQEVTFLLRTEEGKELIMIEGLADQSLRLRDLMVEGMANTYNPRFIKFLERKQLISLSIGAGMGPSEFSRFIDLMSEPAMADMQDRSAREGFTQEVKSRRISHLSFIFNEDFIIAERNLPWRANLALSRMKKDLYLVPIFRDLSPDEMRKVRREVLSDILRPLMIPELVYAFLMNVDLAATAEMSEPDAEDIVLSLIDEKVLVEIASVFIGDASGKDNRYKTVLAEVKYRRMLAKLAKRLYQVKSRESNARLEEMFRAGLLTMEQLPAEVKDLVRVGQLAESFLDKSEDYLKQMDLMEEAEEYREQAGRLIRIIPNILAMGKVEDAIAIADKLYQHVSGDTPRAAAARDLMADLVQNGSLEEAARFFLAAPKEERVVVSRLFQMLGQWSLPHLLRIIRETDDIWRRKQAVELIFKAGPAGTKTLLEELEAKRLPDETLAAVIRALGGCTVKKQHPEIVEAALGMVSHADPEVRREALITLARLDAVRQFDVFRAALGDEDPTVRKQALRCLGATGNREAFESMKEAVLAAERSGDDADWELAAVAIDACGRLYEASVHNREQIPVFLAEVAGKGYPKGTFKRMVGRAQMPLQALAALADALGRTGGPGSRDVLERLAKEKERTISQRASEALKKLKPV